jgi:hypothetical protein
MRHLKVQDRLELTLRQQRLGLTLDAPARQAAEQLDGCYVVETDLQVPQADAQTIHDRYKDLALVERDFRTLKTGHLEFRPWFVCTEDNPQAHALTAMLALKSAPPFGARVVVAGSHGGRRFARTRKALLPVLELVHPESGKVMARQVPDPSARQKQLLDALKLKLLATVPEAQVIVGTRKKINQVRQPLGK